MDTSSLFFEEAALVVILRIEVERQPKDEGTHHACYMQYVWANLPYLTTRRPGPPRLQPVDSVLSLALPVFDALWSADFQAREREPREGQATEFY